MQSHEYRKIDSRATQWVDGEFEHPERFKVERFDGKAWVPLPE